MTKYITKKRYILSNGISKKNAQLLRLGILLNQFNIFNAAALPHRLVKERFAVQNLDLE
jgi:hypothetical protein